MKNWNNQLLKLWFLQATEALCHLCITDIKKTFCNIWFFSKNKACANCTDWKATTVIWLLASKQPSTRFDDLFSIQCKNCAIEIACIDSPHIVIYTTHASSTAHCYTLARRRRNDGSNSSAAASPSQHSPKRPSHGHQRRSAGGAAHRLKR